MLTPRFTSTGRVSLTLTRPSGTGGSYVNGRWVETTTSTSVVIVANIQPVNYKETMLMPEADRSRKMVKIYSASEIFAEEEGERGADEFTWEGDTYKVMKVLNYSMGRLNHFKAIGVMKEKINEPL